MIRLIELCKCAKSKKNIPKAILKKSQKTSFSTLILDYLRMNTFFSKIWLCHVPSFMVWTDGITWAITKDTVR